MVILLFMLSFLCSFVSVSVAASRCTSMCVSCDSSNAARSILCIIQLCIHLVQSTLFLLLCPFSTVCNVNINQINTSRQCQVSKALIVSWSSSIRLGRSRRIISIHHMYKGSNEPFMDHSTCLYIDRFVLVSQHGS